MYNNMKNIHTQNSLSRSLFIFDTFHFRSSAFFIINYTMKKGFNPFRKKLCVVKSEMIHKYIITHLAAATSAFSDP